MRSIFLVCRVQRCSFALFVDNASLSAVRRSLVFLAIADIVAVQTVKIRETVERTLVLVLRNFPKTA